MEVRRLKLLCTGRKGILLPEYPSSLQDLHRIIFTYFRASADEFIISFKDSDGDECEVKDQETYEAAISEFQCKVTLKLVQKQLIMSVPYPTIYPHGRSLLKFFRKKTRIMTIYNLDSGAIENVEFPRGILFKEFAAWIDLPSGEIFYCGGGHPISSDEAYLINPYSRTYKKLPSMKYSRHFHGIAYLNGAVYIFGGVRNFLFYGDKTKKSERFVLDDEYWEEITDIDAPRAAVGAATKGDCIYLVGKGNQSIVQFNSTETNIDLGEDSGGALIVDNNLIYAFHGSQVKICDLVLKKIIEKIQLPGNYSWWSHMPPVWHGDFIYFVWWEDNGWICRINHKTKEFEKLLALAKGGAG